jgi:type IV pilus biogenesis protein CpaD/CtpE
MVVTFRDIWGSSLHARQSVTRQPESSQEVTMKTTKRYPFRVVFPAVLAAAVLLLVSCASKPEDERNTSTSYREGVPGGTWVESYRVPVTIAAVDPATRKVTLVASDNSRNTFTAGPDFKGFDQLHVGDQVQAAVARELVVFMRQHEMPPAADTSVAKELAEDTEHSGILKAETVEKTAKVTAINPNNNEATLQFADGTTRKITVRRDVNVRNVKLGEEVVIRTRSAAVLNLEK